MNKNNDRMSGRVNLIHTELGFTAEVMRTSGAADMYAGCSKRIFNVFLSVLNSLDHETALAVIAGVNGIQSFKPFVSRVPIMHRAVMSMGRCTIEFNEEVTDRLSDESLRFAVAHEMARAIVVDEAYTKMPNVEFNDIDIEACRLVESWGISQTPYTTQILVDNIAPTGEDADSDVDSTDVIVVIE